MTAFSQTATPSVFFGHNATVKAWCNTGHHKTGTNPTQAQFDAANFIDGYNLYIDVQTQNQNSSAPDIYHNGAVKFSFITPMADTNYKVFVQCYGASNPLYPRFAHVLNSVQYPKTRQSFWVRFGYIVNTVAGAAGAPVGGRVGNQVMNILMWDNQFSSIGLVVI
jgi:hypothetical protein